MTVTKPQIQQIDRSDVQGIIKAIARDGGCVVKNFTDAETVKKVNAEAQPYLEADKPWKVSTEQYTCGFYTKIY